MFCFMDEKIVSPSPSLSYVLPLSAETEMENGWSCTDPFEFDWISTWDFDQGYVNMELAAPTPPSIPEVYAYASNESSMSDYCRFTEVTLSLPPMKGVNLDFDLGIEHDDSGPCDGALYRFIVYAHNSLLHHLMMKKDIQPEFVRWYLQLKDSDFVACTKNDAHIFIELEIE